MDNLLDYLIEQAKAWVRSQQSLHRHLGDLLSGTELSALAPFFRTSTLAKVRIREIETIENPDFYAALRLEIQRELIDFEQMKGITFCDTILLVKTNSATRADTSLLFHECVHVVQYHLLGIDDFIEQYITGWAENGYQYEAIPLERDAYQLQGRFDQNPLAPFSVEREQSQRLSQRRGTP